jgi:hypothetical protein
LPDRLELAAFEPCVGQAFGVELAGGERLELTLSEASSGPYQPEGESTFAFELMFRGPREPLLPQATYRMTHPALGELDIFIVPLEADSTGTTYQAVFS